MSLTNGDGLLRKGNTLYVARNQQELIVPVKLSRKGRSGRVGEGVTGHQPSTRPELPFDVATAPKVKKAAKGKPSGKAKPAK